jgi:hypothetical protein
MTLAYSSCVAVCAYRDIVEQPVCIGGSMNKFDLPFWSRRRDCMLQPPLSRRGKPREHVAFTGVEAVSKDAVPARGTLNGFYAGHLPHGHRVAAGTCCLSSLGAIIHV